MSSRKEPAETHPVMVLFPLLSSPVLLLLLLPLRRHPAVDIAIVKYTVNSCSSAANIMSTVFAA